METSASYLKNKVNLTFFLHCKIEAGYVWRKAGVDQKWVKWYYIGKGETAGILGQHFGDRPEYYVKYGLAGHNGNDWPIPEGTCIYAPADGIVSKVNDPIPPQNYQSGYGGYVELFCEQYDGMYFTFLVGHLSDALVKLNDKVMVGDLIALSGNTGDSTGAHVHSTFKETDSQRNIKNSSNGYFGALDEVALYDDILIHKSDELERLYQYEKNTQQWYFGWGGSENFKNAQFKLSIIGVTRSQYMNYLIKRMFN